MSGAIVDLLDHAVLLQKNHEEVVGLCAQRDVRPLCRLHLDQGAGACLCVVALRAAREQLKIVVVARKDFAQGADEVAVRGEWPAGKCCFEFVDELVEAFDDAGDRVDRR